VKEEVEECRRQQFSCRRLMETQHSTIAAHTHQLLFYFIFFFRPLQVYNNNNNNKKEVEERERKLRLAGGRPSSHNQLSAWLCTTHTIIIKVDVPMSLKPQGNLSYYDTIIIIITPPPGNNNKEPNIKNKFKNETRVIFCFVF
jgi:hypothetical protein